MLASGCSVLIDTVDSDGRHHIRMFRGYDVARFTDTVMRRFMDPNVFPQWEFALGFAAAIDALAGGKVDFYDPDGTVIAARNDVFDESGAPCRVTDLMWCVGTGAAHAG